MGKAVKTIIKISIDAEIKQKAEEVTTKLGISLNDAIRSCIYQIIINQGIPFQLNTNPTGLDKPHTKNYIIK